MSNGFEELKKLYPIFKFRNKTNVDLPFELDGDSTQVQAGAVLKLASSKFNQLPSTRQYEFIQPTLDDLRMVGLLNTKPSPSAAPKKPSTPNDD